MTSLSNIPFLGYTGEHGFFKIDASTDEGYGGTYELVERPC